MAFFIISATPMPDGGWAFEDKAKVRLTGPEGPLAAHIIGLPGNSSGEWNLDAGKIATLLQEAPPSEGKIPLLLWDSGVPDSVPQRVIRFCGVSREFDTELLVHMEILGDAGGYLKGTGRHTNEALRLLGGRATPKARWIWAAPKMAIGSTKCPKM